MGGINESMCPSLSPGKPQIRYHENKQRGEVDFHDDMNGLKCSVVSTRFFTEYHKWRDSHIEDDLTLLGRNSSGDPMSVTFHTSIDKNVLRVGMAIQPVTMDQTVVDLDKLAGYGG